MTPTYYGHVRPDGTLALRAPALAGKDVVVRERKAQRSIQANARYWAMLTIAAREIGYETVDELHEGLAMKLLPLPELVPGVPRRRRTPKLNTKAFAEYTDACERFLRVELGVDLHGWEEEIPIEEAR